MNDCEKEHELKLSQIASALHYFNNSEEIVHVNSAGLRLAYFNHFLGKKSPSTLQAINPICRTMDLYRSFSQRKSAICVLAGPLPTTVHCFLPPWAPGKRSLFAAVWLKSLRWTNLQPKSNG